jgi:hypothetical protein
MLPKIHRAAFPECTVTTHASPFSALCCEPAASAFLPQPGKNEINEPVDLHDMEESRRTGSELGNRRKDTALDLRCGPTATDPSQNWDWERAIRRCRCFCGSGREDGAHHLPAHRPRRLRGPREDVHLCQDSTVTPPAFIRLGTTSIWDVCALVQYLMTLKSITVSPGRSCPVSDDATTFRRKLQTKKHQQLVPLQRPPFPINAHRPRQR